MITFEKLERRDLLAVDLQLVSDPIVLDIDAGQMQLQIGTVQANLLELDAGFGEGLGVENLNIEVLEENQDNPIAPTLSKRLFLASSYGVGPLGEDPIEVLTVNIETPDTSFNVLMDDVEVSFAIDDADTDFDVVVDIDEADVDLNLNHADDVFAVDAVFSEHALDLDFSESTDSALVDVVFANDTLQLTESGIDNLEVEFVMQQEAFQLNTITDEGSWDLTWVEESFQTNFSYDGLQISLAI